MMPHTEQEEPHMQDIILELAKLDNELMSIRNRRRRTCTISISSLSGWFNDYLFGWGGGSGGEVGGEGGKGVVVVLALTDGFWENRRALNFPPTFSNLILFFQSWFKNAR